MNLSSVKNYNVGKHTMGTQIRCIAFLCLSMFAVIPLSANSDLESFNQGKIVINGTEYNLEIAKTQAQRSQGLMYRKSLPEKGGMVFIFPRSGDHRIWMKNTLIPLVVVWLDERNTVIEVKQLPPCITDICTVYGVSRPSKYIIELNAGTRGIKPGDRITGIELVE